MKKISDLISKPAFVAATAQKFGYVLGVELSSDFKKLSGIIVVDEESEVEARIDASDVTVGRDAVFFKSEPTFIEAQHFSSPIGKIVFDKDARCLGRVKDVYLNRSKVVAICTEKLCFLPKNICVSSDSAIFLFGKKPSRKPFNFQNASLQPERLVQITAAPSAAVPYRVSAQGRSLIGKIATRDILGLNNELIIKEHEVITQKKINEAKKHNKLNILFYNCK